MSKSHVYQPSVTIPGGSITASQKTYSADGHTQLDLAVPANQTNMLVALVIDVSQLKSIVIKSSVDMTLEFNNSTTGVPTINLKAGVPYIWNTDSYDSLLLSADVTALYVTNTTAGTLELSAIVDPTV